MTAWLTSGKSSPGNSSILMKMPSSTWRDRSVSERSTAALKILGHRNCALTTPTRTHSHVGGGSFDSTVCDGIPIFWIDSDGTKMDVYLCGFHGRVVSRWLDSGEGPYSPWDRLMMVQVQMHNWYASGTFVDFEPSALELTQRFGVTPIGPQSGSFRKRLGGIQTDEPFGGGLRFVGWPSWTKWCSGWVNIWHLTIEWQHASFLQN